MIIIALLHGMPTALWSSGCGIANRLEQAARHAISASVLQMSGATTVLSLAALLVATIIALPASAQTAKKSKTAVDRILAIYVPQIASDERFLVPGLNAAFAPGKALEQAATAAAVPYFKSVMLFNGADTPFDLVLSVHFKWDNHDRDSKLTVKYKLLDASGAVLLEDSKSDDINTQKLFIENAFTKVSLGVMKDIVADDTFLDKAMHSNPVPVQASGFDRKYLIDHEKPVKTGTGFFINDHGQLMTAAHVIHGCQVTEAKVNGKAVDATLLAKSSLLDLAVLDTGDVSPHAISLRTGTSFDLGEGVINVGFPLSGVLAGSANVTRGNISSREALAGSLGQFQFSAPVQPGSSGGPVVSETGELLGVTVASLSLASLAARGIIPQNVNFALDAHYAASFMDKNKIRYASVERGRTVDAHAVTESILPAVVQVSCYE
jgi:serine protease Do